MTDGAQAVRDDETRAAVRQRREHPLDARLGARVD